MGVGQHTRCGQTSPICEIKTLTMKTRSIFILAFIVSALSLLAGCKAIRSVTDTARTAQGAPYELVVVCNQKLWDSELGDTLRSVLRTPVPYLIEQEPQFQVRRILEKDFRGMLADHRNILKVVEDSSLPTTSLALQYNVSAAPQVVLTLQGPSQEALTEYVSIHKEQLLEVLEMAERDRSIAYADRFNQPELSKLIREMFGVEMNVPKGYILASRATISSGSATNSPRPARDSCSTPTRTKGRTPSRNSRCSRPATASPPAFPVRATDPT